MQKGSKTPSEETTTEEEVEGVGNGTEESGADNMGAEKKTPSPSSLNAPPSQLSRIKSSPSLLSLGSGELALSFSGCGFLGTYHFGSVACFLKHGPTFLGRVGRVAGASAGSLVASVLVSYPDKLQESLGVLYSLADELNSLKFGALTPGFSLIRRLETLIEDMLPKDSHVIAKDRVFISVTKMSNRTNSLVHSFDDRNHLVKHLLASCYIPVYAGVKENPPLIDGEEYADGGLTDNLPKFKDMRTVTVSPFSGEAEISPNDTNTIFDWTMKLSNQTMKVNLKNVVRGAQALFPPTRSVLESYYDLGFCDTMKFLLDNDAFERPKGTEV